MGTLKYKNNIQNRKKKTVTIGQKRIPLHKDVI